MSRLFVSSEGNNKPKLFLTIAAELYAVAVAPSCSQTLIVAKYCSFLVDENADAIQLIELRRDLLN